MGSRPGRRPSSGDWLLLAAPCLPKQTGNVSSPHFQTRILTPRQQYYVAYGPAVRQGSAYKYENSIVPGFPPFHPNPGKSALLCVTTSGVLKLFYSQNNNKHEEATVELDNVNSSGDRITHASLNSDRSKSQCLLPFYKNFAETFRWSLDCDGDCFEADQDCPSSDSMEPAASR
jgi:hypothetical protein